MAKTIIVSHSEIDTARQCPHKHQLGYVERWVSPQTGRALAIGTLWHEVMDGHYRMLKMAQDHGIARPTEKDLLVAAAPLLIPEVGNPSEYQELVRWMYEGYLTKYGTDEEWFIVAVEHKSLVWLPTDTGGRSRFQLKLKMDLVIRKTTNKKLYVVDHKSGQNLPNDKMLEINDQFGLYTWGLRKQGKKVFAQIHNAARTQRNKTTAQPLDERFRRTELYRTDSELDQIALDAYYDMRDRYRPGAADQRHANEDTCRWRCDFTDACLYGRKTTPEAERAYLLSAGYRQDFTRH